MVCASMFASELYFTWLGVNSAAVSMAGGALPIETDSKVEAVPAASRRYFCKKNSTSRLIGVAPRKLVKAILLRLCIFGL